MPTTLALPQPSSKPPVSSSSISVNNLPITGPWAWISGRIFSTCPRPNQGFFMMAIDAINWVGVSTLFHPSIKVFCFQSSVRRISIDMGKFLYFSKCGQYPINKQTQRSFLALHIQPQRGIINKRINANGLILLKFFHNNLRRSED